MDKTALLKKIRALAEHGVGGEAENAEKLLARMMKKYGISEAELDEETRVRHDFTYHGGEEKKILKQVVYKVTGGYTYELVYTASGRKVRTQLGADCTPAEAEFPYSRRGMGANVRPRKNRCYQRVERLRRSHK